MAERFKQKLAIWGASGHAQVVAEIIRCVDNYQIVAFFDDQSPISLDGHFQGIPIVSDIEQLRTLYERGTRVGIVAFGHCNARLRSMSILISEGFELATAVHPRALIASDVSIGCGSVIVGGAVVNPGSKVGKSVIVNTSASVDHECVIEDGAHIGPGAHLGGRVNIGRAAWIGIGATVADRIRVGANSIVGAGAVVLDDVEDNTVVVGVPARTIRKVNPDEN